MSISERSVTCSFFFRNCTHDVDNNSGKKFEDTFVVKLVREPPLSLIPTCPKNRKIPGLLRFPETGILTTIAILRTARFTIMGKIADCSWY